jgi:hypothetical protein
MKNMKKWKIILGLSVVLVSGIIIGVVSTLFYMQSNVRGMLRGDYAPARRIMVRRIDRLLDLDREQFKELRKAAKAVGMDLKKLRDQWRPEVKRIIDRRMEEFKQCLTPEQKLKFERMTKRIKKMRKKGPLRKRNNRVPKYPPPTD